ncbi:MAG: VWA domain-containing protein [Pseudomonadota bacterium]
MKILRQILLGSAVLAAASAQSHAADRAMIVMDASGSMWGQIDGKTKIEIARETLADVLTSVPVELELGLIAYGHREKGQCGDIEEIVAPATGNRDAITDAVNGFNPKGKTPLTDAVRQAAQSLQYTEDKATVILVTDGIETCEADPCAVASELEASGVDFTAHVVGFGISEEEGQQVACLAENTGGDFILASDASELGDALTETVAATPAPPPEPEPTPAPPPIAGPADLRAVLTEGGPPVEGGRWDVTRLDIDETKTSYGLNPTYDFMPGDYRVTFKIDRVERSIDVTAANAPVTGEIVLDAGLVTLDVAFADGSELIGDARIDVKSGELVNTQYGTFSAVTPAGPTPVKVRSGRAEADHEIEVVAGEAVAKTLVLPAGRITANATFNDGSEVVPDVRYDILEAKASLSGDRKTVETQYNVIDAIVAPGDYVMRVRSGGAAAEMEFSVEQNALTDITVPMDAGLVAVSAPGAGRIDILTSPSALTGKQDRLATQYQPEVQLILNRGSYVVRGEFGEDRAVVEQEFTISAGQRTEVTLEQ